MNQKPIQELFKSSWIFSAVCRRQNDAGAGRKKDLLLLREAKQEKVLYQF